jgi:hypothetical protein
MNWVWTSSTPFFGFVLEVTCFRELVQWCVDKSNSKKRIIQIQGKLPISLAPPVFDIILCIPMPAMQFKVEEDNELLKQHKGGEEILDKYLVDTINNTSSYKIEVSSL